MRVAIIHHDDWDGMVSGWIARDVAIKRGDSVSMFMVGHSEPFPAVSGFDHVYLLDFCPAPEKLDDLAKESGTMLVIDHHVSAMTAVKSYGDAHGFPQNVFFKMLAEDGGVPISACLLTWRHFHGTKPPPWLVRYTNDHDTWAFGLVFSRQIRAELQCHPLTLEECYALSRISETDGLAQLVREGASIVRYQKMLIAEAVDRAKPMAFGPMVGLGTEMSCRSLQSEIAGELAGKPGCDFGCCWRSGNGGAWAYSLSSRGNCDVSKIAVEQGGGGHVHAAGFSSTKLPSQFQR